MLRNTYYKIVAIVIACLVIFSLRDLMQPSVVYVDKNTNEVVKESDANGEKGQVGGPMNAVGQTDPEVALEKGTAEETPKDTKGEEKDDQTKDVDSTGKEGEDVAAKIPNVAPNDDSTSPSPEQLNEGAQKQNEESKAQSSEHNDQGLDAPSEESNEKDKEDEFYKGLENLSENRKDQLLKEHKYLPSGERAKATFVTLARNSELYDLLLAIRNVEDRFNNKFHYDWVFLNDEPFTEEFKTMTSAIISGKTKYGLIPKEHWSYPDWIDLERAAESRARMKAAKIIYGDMESYRHMCRFESGFFWQNELLDEYEWYWRVEPGIRIHCDLNYDLFKYMEDNQKVYGFTISIHEFAATIPSLWGHTKDFMKAHPEYVAENNLLDFISNDKGETYNLCHFWSNFEVASLNFWRSKAYREYFDYLDKTGGFFYERWGDAPVHSLAAALFLPRDKIHYFDDVGYNHHVYTQCPLNQQFRVDHKCDCNPDKDFTFRGYSCGQKYYDVTGLKKPDEWKDYD